MDSAFLYKLPRCEIDARMLMAEFHFRVPQHETRSTSMFSIINIITLAQKTLLLFTKFYRCTENLTLFVVVVIPNVATLNVNKISIFNFPFFNWQMCRWTISTTRNTHYCQASTIFIKKLFQKVNGVRGTLSIIKNVFFYFIDNYYSR